MQRNRQAEELEMDKLLGMGFSQDVATRALAATGASSAALAADWILSNNIDHHDNDRTNSTPPPQRRRLDSFFLKTSFTPPDQKRPKLSSPASDNPPLPLAPLADRMRPATLSEVLGQGHLLSDGSVLRSAVDAAALPSIVLWGPPGSGKTSIARALAASLPSFRFVPLSAVTAGVKDVRDAVDAARRRRASSGGSRTLLFVDEVHRFSRAQLDSFLPAVEDGSVVFVGATTENPSFHLTTPLLSRCRVLSLRPLAADDLRVLLQRAAADSCHGLPLAFSSPISVADDAVDFLSNHCDGDARVALNALELAATLAKTRSSNGNGDGAVLITVTGEDAREAMQCKHLAYDRAGDEHYNLISALHKSMRGSDADAAIYWLARMLEAGEQPLYIARRLVRFASEDVGLADPAALTQAVACYQACHFIGMPECDVILAQCASYLALAPKSVAVYKAMGAAKAAVRQSEGGNEGVPMHLRNAPTKLMKEMGYGKDYLYPPDHRPEDCSKQTYLPPSLAERKFLDWPPT